MYIEHWWLYGVLWTMPVCRGHVLAMVGAGTLTAKSVLPVMTDLVGLGASSACHAISEKYMQWEYNCLHVYMLCVAYIALDCCAELHLLLTTDVPLLSQAVFTAWCECYFLLEIPRAAFVIPERFQYPFASLIVEKTISEKLNVLD